MQTTTRQQAYYMREWDDFERTVRTWYRPYNQPWLVDYAQGCAVAANEARKLIQLNGCLNLLLSCKDRATFEALQEAYRSWRLENLKVDVSLTCRNDTLLSEAHLRDEIKEQEKRVDMEFRIAKILYVSAIPAIARERARIKRIRLGTYALGVGLSLAAAKFVYGSFTTLDVGGGLAAVLTALFVGCAYTFVAGGVLSNVPIKQAK